MLTALKLADNGHDNGTHIFPSVKTVAHLTYQSERTVQRHLRAMEKKGWLLLEEEAYRPGRTRTYRIPIERIPQRVVARVTKCHPSPEGATTGTKGVTPVTERGDTAMSPQPSLTISEPSVSMSGKPDLNRAAIGILNFLNEKTGRHYKPKKVNLDLIIARLKEGTTEEELRQVIAKKCREWTGDATMAMYLRPATLFNRTKFAQYEGELTHAMP